MRQGWARFFALGDTWRRPLPRHWLRQDLLSAAAFLLLAVVGLELARSMSLLAGTDRPVWAQYVALVLTAAIVVWRRRYPLTAMVLVAGAMFVTGVLMPEVMMLFIPQTLYLFGFFSALAWGAPRTRTVAVTGAAVAFMFAWIGWQFVWGDGMDQVPPMRHGLLGPRSATVLYSLLINVVFFGGAVAVGQVTWRTARQRAELQQQAEQIEAQSRELQEQATLDERLRIARELHDVVAHHVAVIGIQAGAARKTLDRRPEMTAGALQQVEDSAREAVGEMRSLLGTLRADDDDRAPQPTVRDIPALVDEVRARGLQVSYAEVEASPGMLGEVPSVVGLSLYRTVQEALSNIRRHSTADSARVVLRALEESDGSYAEVEVLDDGDPRGGTGGSGLGLVGMRERITAQGGLGDIGPRETGGYRVRVRLPLTVRS